MKADVEDARSLNRRHLPRIGLASNERSHFQLRQTISATIDKLSFILPWNQLNRELITNCKQLWSAIGNEFAYIYKNENI